jgi:DNA-binding GntR family transcriptional regulator
MGEAVVGIRRSIEIEDWEAAVAADRAFHAALVAMLHSPRLDRFYDQISAESRFVLGILWLRDAADNLSNALAEVADEHRSIYESIAAGRRAEARRLLEAHLAINETRVLEIIEARVAATG